MKGYRFAILSNGSYLYGRFRIGQLVATPYGARKVVECGFECDAPMSEDARMEIACGVQ